MRPGQLIVIAGRPAMGKTAIALGVAESAAHKGGATLFFSQEMPGEELANRSLSRASGLPLDKILDGRKFESEEDFSRLTAGTVKVSELELLVDEQPQMSLAEIRARARNAKRRHGLGLIVIDYLGLMADGEGNTRNEKVGANSRGLKALAKQMEVPVVLLAQLNRKLEERHDKRPMLSDLRDSGEIEQDADIVLFLYRDEVYNPNTRDRGIGEINVAKQRNGPTGTVAAAYIGERTLFADLMPGTQFGQKDESDQQRPRRGFQ
jgi:replicative DNA helicase